MKSKEIKELSCLSCDSSFKIIYHFEEVNGYHKFCPFCSAELTDEDDEKNDEFEDNGYHIDD